MLVIDAVGASDLPADLKLLLFAMAYLAESSTGKGLTGQARLARFISCSDRAVRLKLERLAAMPDSPVQVVRRPRLRPDGRGRTSDEYQLVLRQPPTGSGLPLEQPPPTGSPLPVGEPSPVLDQPEAESGPTGSPVLDQPEARFQGSSQGILLDDPRSTSTRARRASKGAPKPRRLGRSKPERTPEQRAAQAALTAYYFAEFERLRGCKPIGWGAADGEHVYTLLSKVAYDVPKAERIVTNGLQSWDKATIRSIAANPSACVASAAPPRLAAGQRAADLLPLQLERIKQLEADEARAGLPTPQARGRLA